MRAKSLLPIMLAIAVAVLLMAPALAAPGKEKFIELVDDKLVVRLPQKALVGRSFNIGIYVADSLVGDSGGDYEAAELYISVSGPGTCVMWNDWFEAQELKIAEDSDLIVAPYVDQFGIWYYSMEYDEAVSKLDDIAGWTGNVVCLVDAAGDYTFKLTDADGNELGSFTIKV